MEGPIRSSSARHSYLMLSARTTRSTTKPDTRLKSQLPSSPCVRGAPRMVPFSAVRDFYAHLVLPHKGFRPAISRFFGRPQTVHSSAEVIPLQAQILHRKSTDGRRVASAPAFPAGSHARDRPGGRSSVGQTRDQPDHANKLGQTGWRSGGQPADQSDRGRQPGRAGRPGGQAADQLDRAQARSGREEFS